MNRTDRHHNQPTADQSVIGQSADDQRRADALRWILAIAEQHHLPVPERIDLSNYHSGWSLHLHLDDGHADDVRRWGDTLNLRPRPDLTIDGPGRAFTCLRADGTPPDVVFAGWDLVVVDCYRTIDVAADAVPLAAAA